MPLILSVDLTEIALFDKHGQAGIRDRFGSGIIGFGFGE
jgi:hypothetical protein